MVKRICPWFRISYGVHVVISNVAQLKLGWPALKASKVVCVGKLGGLRLRFLGLDPGMS